MENYIDINIKNTIDSLTVCQGVAKATGNPYFYLDLVFINGYSKRIFLNDDSKFAIQHAIDSVYKD